MKTIFLNNKVSFTLKVTGAVVLSSILLYVGILAAFPFPYDTIKNIHYSTIVYDKDGETLHAFTNVDGRWLLPVQLNEINPSFINATIAAEDRDFKKHHGVDLSAIFRAVWQNISNRRVISGASTLSMQTIRLLENRHRNYLNKLIETVHAIRLETLYSKDEILKMYFELAPYGGNVHGIKAAARKYFNKSPKDLTLSESALLAGLPQSPSRLRPDRYPQRAQKRRDMVLLCMLQTGYIDQKHYDLAKADPVVKTSYSFPFETPHFAYIAKKASDNSEITTTIDSKIQHFAEGVLKSSVDKLRDSGVTNGAIVIIENATGKVRAYVGSADFFSKNDFGQVDGALSGRSPGSALKPFTYALGFDSRMYSTETQIDDSASRYSEYLPRNYDKKFRGMVSVRDALVDSLNIPAVEVLDNVGYVKLYDLLKEDGLTTLKKNPEAYGLSLTLGSPEVKLLELTNAYASLARLGVYKPYKIVEENSIDVGRRVVSEGAAYLIADILSDSSRLESVGLYRNEKVTPKVVFKTGTSYGQRDAWTFAYNPEFTIGVWLGNFSGRSSKALVGLESATPVAFKIFDWMYANKKAPWFDMPQTVKVRSGKDLFVKNSHAPETKSLTPREQDKPNIVSPAGGAEYFISGPQNIVPELPFSAKPGMGASELYWFLNGQFLSKVLPGEKFFWEMHPGQYQLTCADNLGRSTGVSFYVR
ncbi:MAG: penicillin-binding protein 1C [Candidatus Omnitrophica bacterium]|nr:penicillin-binding protein 1C [Candidatus Omnitrophota bacterium]